MGLVGPVGLVSVCPIALVQLVYMKIQITFLKIYDGCAFDPTMDLAPWCSTKVMFLHWNMVIGHENNVRRLLMVYYSFFHHYQGSIDFNTVNIHRNVGMYFLVSTGNRGDIE